MTDAWSKTPNQEGFGRKGKQVAPSDTTDLLDVAKAITVLTEGTLAIVPVDNSDADIVTYSSGPVGFTPPFIVRRVMATGTSAVVATVDG